MSEYMTMSFTLNCGKCSVRYLKLERGRVGVSIRFVAVSNVNSFADTTKLYTHPC